MPDLEAPCRDGIEEFWLRQFLNLPDRIRQEINQRIANGRVSKYLEGRTPLAVTHMETIDLYNYRRDLWTFLSRATYFQIR